MIAEKEETKQCPRQEGGSPLCAATGTGKAFDGVHGVVLGLSRRHVVPGPTGYTFMELVVVILLVGILLSLAVPRIQDALLSDELKGTTRRLMALIGNLRAEAVRESVDFALHLDLDEGRYWVECSSMSEEEAAREQKEAPSFPAGIRVLDVWLRGHGKIITGEVWIKISRKGYIQPSAIHLEAEDGRRFTLEMSPFLGKVKFYDRYIEYEEV